MPLSDEGAKFVGGKVKTVKVCQTVLALDFVDPELDLSESMALIILKVGKGDFEDPAFESVVGIFLTTCTIH